MEIVFAFYWFAVLGLFAYGMNCYWLTLSYRRNKRQNEARIARVRERFHSCRKDEDLPTVTVQLPVYNERWVVGRLIHAIARLDYPRTKLQVQVLDDSTDDTSSIVERAVELARAEGLDIEHLRRPNRAGFKAGALRDAMHRSRGELVAIFDADFVPRPDYLRETVPFFDQPEVGLVQCRWGHVNEGYSALTRAQAIAIDGHFGIEQAGRAWGGYLLNFNGTAGVWRRRAIEDAGGWQVDTLTEDLDLSYRAQLAGWRIEFLPDVEVPAEIPVDISSFKAQQRRWAKGSIQTAIKLLPRVFRAPIGFARKVQAVLHMTHYLVHPLMLTVALLSVPLLAFWSGRWGPLPFALLLVLLVLATAGPSTLYLSAQRALRPDWLRRMARMPMLLVLGTGIAVSNSRAVFEAIVGIESGFVRTPKHNVVRARSECSASRRGYRIPFGGLLFFEVFLAGYSWLGLALYLHAEKYLIGPYLLLYASGFSFMAIASVREIVAIKRAHADVGAEGADSDPLAGSADAYHAALASSESASLARSA